MLSLNQMLADFDITHLRAIAGQLGVALESNAPLDIAEQLAASLRDPVFLSDLYRRLSPAERDALAALLRAGGRLRAHVFFHQFGPIRLWGTARVERERPWEQVAGAAEALWYKGLIGRAFAQEAGETVEFVFIPRELRPLLPAPAEPPPAAVDLTATATPAHLEPAVDSLEDLFQLLVYIQLHHPRATAEGLLGVEDVARVQGMVGRPDPAEEGEPAPRLAFLQHLARRLGLIELQAGRLHLASEAARVWLTQPSVPQRRSLADAWLGDEMWNDLWHVTSLRPEPVGWSNDPARTRQRFLDQLASLPAEVWHAIPALIAGIHATDPDFQRPDGDYAAWYIHDRASDALLQGFEHWEQVEGALILYYLRRPLFWLAIVELGTAGTRSPASSDAERTVPRSGALSDAEPEFASEDANSSTDLFRITEAGARFIAGVEEPPADVTPAAVVLDEDLQITLAAGTSLYHRLQLERFAERVSGPLAYRITAGSLLKARSQEITLAAVRRFLEKLAGAELTTAQGEALLHRWKAVNRIRSRRLVALEFAEPAVLEWLREDPETAPLLGKIVSETGVVVAEGRLSRLLARLRKLGLSPEVVTEGS